MLGNLKQQDLELLVKNYFDKTEWVQEKTNWPFPVLGLERLDVINRYISHLESRVLVLECQNSLYKSLLESK